MSDRSKRAAADFLRGDKERLRRKKVLGRDYAEDLRIDRNERRRVRVEERDFPMPSEADFDSIQKDLDDAQDRKCSNCKELRQALKRHEMRETALTRAVEVLAVRLTMAMTNSGRTW